MTADSTHRDPARKSAAAEQGFPDELDQAAGDESTTPTGRRVDDPAERPGAISDDPAREPQRGPYP